MQRPRRGLNSQTLGPMAITLTIITTEDDELPVTYDVLSTEDIL
jgi:hypothetical protein